MGGGYRGAAGCLARGDARAAAGMYADALQSPERYLQFLGLTDMEQLARDETRLMVGESVTALLQVANRYPDEFRARLAACHERCTALLRRHRELPPLRLYMALLLRSFAGLFLGREDGAAVAVADYYFDLYERRGEPLPEAYCRALAEQCVFAYVERGRLDRAYRLERSQDLLGALMARDGPGVLELVCALVGLRRRLGEDVGPVVEAAKLRFGEAEVEACLRRAAVDRRPTPRDGG